MSQNLFYRNVVRRQSELKDKATNLLITLTSWPRMILQVFIRKNFGERYFSFGEALFAVLLIYIVILLTVFTGNAIGFFRGSGQMLSNMSEWESWGFIMFFVFLIAFIVFSLIRRSEIKRSRSQFNIRKYSLYSGDINARFYRFQPSGKAPSIRAIETRLEPAACFLVGLVLCLIPGPLGPFIMFCSCCYSMNYRACYHLGDNFILDRMDEALLNNLLGNALMDGIMEDKDISHLHLPYELPEDKKQRRLILSIIAPKTVNQDQENGLASAS